jgi:heme exporter protein D
LGCDAQAAPECCTAGKEYLDALTRSHHWRLLCLAQQLKLVMHCLLPYDIDAAVAVADTAGAVQAVLLIGVVFIVVTVILSKRMLRKVEAQEKAREAAAAQAAEAAEAAETGLVQPSPQARWKASWQPAKQQQH